MTVDHMNAHVHRDGSIGYEYPCPAAGIWTLACEQCGKTFKRLESWQVDGEATHHTCPSEK